jgi:hypothetical protein
MECCREIRIDERTRSADAHRKVMRVISTGRFELTQIDAVRTLITSPDGIAGKPINRRGTFIDVGANIGLYTIALLNFFDNIIAFEAEPA